MLKKEEFIKELKEIELIAISIACKVYGEDEKDYEGFTIDEDGEIEVDFSGGSCGEYSTKFFTLDTIYEGVDALLERKRKEDEEKQRKRKEWEAEAKEKQIKETEINERKTLKRLKAKYEKGME